MEEHSWDVLMSVGRIRSDFLEGPPPNSHSAPSPISILPYLPYLPTLPYKNYVLGARVGATGGHHRLGSTHHVWGLPKAPHGSGGGRGATRGVNPLPPPLPVPRLTGRKLIRRLLRRLFLAVATEMTVKMGTDAETPSTLRARERLLTGMCPSVLSQC